MAKTDLTIPIQVNEARSIVIASDLVDIEINGYDAENAFNLIELVFREARGETKPTYTWTVTKGANTNPITVPYAPDVQKWTRGPSVPLLTEISKEYRDTSYENGTYSREEDRDFLEFDDKDCCLNPENCTNAACGI